MKTQKPFWRKVPAQIKGAIHTYRKGVGSVAIHDYGAGDKPFHMECIGVSERFDTLEEAKAYGNGFVVSNYE